MKEKLKAFLIRESFRPGWISLFTSPFYIARKGLYNNIVSLSSLVHGRVLDVGCGLKPYEKLFNSLEYIGLEIDSPNSRKNKKADYFYEGHKFPFESADFDTVMVNQVLEHVFLPEKFLSEIHRVLRFDGGLLLTTPFLWDEHEQPFDFARYTSYGLKYMLEKHGFEVIEQRKSVADLRLIFQLINCYIHKRVANWDDFFKFMAWFILIPPMNIAGEMLYRLFPKNPDLYLDNVVFARKKRLHE